ncbi:MAG: hypothetical protein M3R02_23530 [Chloroflexota bacterium]|nr:hypothetical protein [Chloroflexota bacterium]
MDHQPALSDTRVSPAPRRRAIPLLAGLFVIVGGILQGIGANIQRYADPDTAWGGVGVLIGGALSVWFARRLRWWLLLYIPAIIILMIPIALITEIETGGLISELVARANEPSECRGWQDLNANLAPLSTSVRNYFDDINNTAKPSPDDDRRWANSAAAIRQQFETLDHPPVLNTYIDLSVQTFRLYEQGFGAMANGDYDDGQSLLEQGDSIRTQAQAAFRTANARCAT